MRRPFAFIVVFVLLGAAMAGVYVKRSGSALAAARTEGEDSAGAIPVAEARDDEVRRLRAELEKKDRVIGELVAQALPKAGPSAPAAPPPPTPAGRDPTACACEVLDDRLAAAPPNPSLTAVAERAIRALDAKVMGASKVASVACAGGLCKVALTGESDAAIETTVGAMAEQLPKTFAATAIYATRDGERSVYLARSGEDLLVEPEDP